MLPAVAERIASTNNNSSSRERMNSCSEKTDGYGALFLWMQSISPKPEHLLGKLVLPIVTPAPQFRALSVVEGRVSCGRLRSNGNTPFKGRVNNA